MDEPVLAKEIFDRLRQATAKTPEVLTELCRDYVSEARAAIGQMEDALRALAALKTVEAELEREFGPAVLPGEGSAA